MTMDSRFLFLCPFSFSFSLSLISSWIKIAAEIAGCERGEARLMSAEVYSRDTSIWASFSIALPTPPLDLTSSHFLHLRNSHSGNNTGGVSFHVARHSTSLVKGWTCAKAEERRMSAIIGSRLLVTSKWQNPAIHVANEVCIRRIEGECPTRC